MITQEELKKHFLDLKDAIYVWGANCETITETSIKKWYDNYKSATYNKAYYDGKLAEGKGRIGADCSGAFCKVSGYDATAAGYYERCKEKGKIGTIPTNKVCMVFKRNSKGIINHIGCYTGDGYVSEMASSKKNYQRKPLAGNGWDNWGLPNFVDYSAETSDTEKVSDKTSEKKASEVDMPQIKYGSKGKAVGIVQVIVGVKVDEDFGPKTEKAVKAFQKAHGLTVDGIVGPKTWPVMLESV